jgi:predicted lipase
MNYSSRWTWIIDSEACGVLLKTKLGNESLVPPSIHIFSQPYPFVYSLNHTHSYILSTIPIRIFSQPYPFIYYLNHTHSYILSTIPIRIFSQPYPFVYSLNHTHSYILSIIPIRIFSQPYPFVYSLKWRCYFHFGSMMFSTQANSWQKRPLRLHKR